MPATDGYRMRIQKKGNRSGFLWGVLSGIRTHDIQNHNLTL